MTGVPRLAGLACALLISESACGVRADPTAPVGELLVIAASSVQTSEAARLFYLDVRNPRAATLKVQRIAWSLRQGRFTSAPRELTGAEIGPGETHRFMLGPLEGSPSLDSLISVRLQGTLYLEDASLPEHSPIFDLPVGFDVKGR